MSRSYLLPYIAAIGLFVATGSVLAQPLRNDAGGQSSAARTQDKPQSDETSLALRAIKDAINRLTGTYVAEQNKPKTAEEKERTARDLKAQEDMAYWAKWMFGAAGAEAFLTFIGIILVWRTLVYTKGAVEEAKKTTAAAIKAADAADLSAKAAIGIELPLLRATPGDFIFSEHPTEDGTPIGGGINDHYAIWRFPHLSLANLLVHNNGRTDAFPIRLEIGYFIGNSLPETPIVKREIRYAPNDVIASKTENNYSFDMYLAVNLTENEIQTLRDGGNFWFYCTFYYTDFMDGPHEHGFCWRWSEIHEVTERFGFQKELDAPQDYTRKT